MLRFLLAMLLLLPAPARALQEQVYSTETFTREFILSNVPDYVKTPEGGTGWDVFGTTREVEFAEKDADGMDLMGIKPEFSPALEALDGQTIVMQGYMFPLEHTEKQTRFLFGPFPATCPFHYHVGPMLVIEARAKDGLPYTYDPVTLTGRLELVPIDYENGIFYRLHDVTRR